MSSIVGRGNHFRLKDPFKVNLDVWVDNDNEYTPAELIEMWDICTAIVWSEPVHVGSLGELIFDYLYDKEMVLNFLVFLGVDV